MICFFISCTHFIEPFTFLVFKKRRQKIKTSRRYTWGCLLTDRLESKYKKLARMQHRDQTSCHTVSAPSYVTHWKVQGGKQARHCSIRRKASTKILLLLLFPPPCDLVRFGAACSLRQGGTYGRGGDLRRRSPRQGVASTHCGIHTSCLPGSRSVFFLHSSQL